VNERWEGDEAEAARKESIGINDKRKDSLRDGHEKEGRWYRRSG